MRGRRRTRRDTKQVLEIMDYEIFGKQAYQGNGCKRDSIAEGNRIKQKGNFPKEKIVAWIPSAVPELLFADYNVPQSDWAAWVSLFATS